MQPVAIGIDVGGTGIKGAAIDPIRGKILTQRQSVPTPRGATPKDVVHEVGMMVRTIRADLAKLSLLSEGIPIGIALPGVVIDGVMRTAANIAPNWVGTDVVQLFSQATGSSCEVMNDADAAGVAEASFGAARGLPGSTMVLTFGTGIGSALVRDGVLIPNFELGHLHLDGHPDIEQYASAQVIHREGITLLEWADRAARYISHLEHVLHPDRFIIGGAISQESAQYLPFTGVNVPVFPAHFHNDAGFVGAARLANYRSSVSADPHSR